MLTHKSRSVRGAEHEPKAAQRTCKSFQIPSQGFGFVTLIISHVFPSLILSHCTLNRITVASKVLNLLNRCGFLQSPAVKCGHIGDFWCLQHVRSRRQSVWFMLTVRFEPGATFSLSPPVQNTKSGLWKSLRCQRKPEPGLTGKWPWITRPPSLLLEENT